MTIFYIVAAVYTIIWIVIWWLVLRHKNKQFDMLFEEYEKLEAEYNTLKDDHIKLEGQYEELWKIMSLRESNSKPTLAEQGHLLN